MKGSILLGTLRWPAPPSTSPHGPLRSRGETSALVFRHTQPAQNTEQMCFSITLITLFTHSMFYSEKQNKKSTPSSYLWKVLFPTVIEIRIPFHPSGKRKKKQNPRTWVTCRKESAGRLRPQLNPGVRERREEALETEVKART